MAELAIKAEKAKAEKIRGILYRNNLLNRSYNIKDENGFIIFPVMREIPESIIVELEEIGMQMISLDEPSPRQSTLEPFDRILELTPIPEDKKELLPRKWELIGDVLIIKIPDELGKFKDVISKIYSEVLGSKTVLEERSGISGTTRIPDMEILYGNETETVHVENRIKYKLDTKQIMFSSGNISERLRMMELNCFDEAVVDMFAGIGYFTLPVAVYTKPRSVTALEINPVSFGYLKQNIELNGVGQIVNPILGDCRITAPEGTADRIIMGLIKDTRSFLSKAMTVLKPGGGLIHYHDVYPNEDIPSQPEKVLAEAGAEAGFEFEMANYTKIKSYAPGISHIVLDAKFQK